MMRVRLIATIALLATAWSSPRAIEPVPAVSVSVPAACADVWQHVFKDFGRSWNVTVLAPSKKDQALPMPAVLDEFLASVPGLDKALAHMDALDKDLFYVRLHIGRLAELEKQYPKIDPALLERAKVQVCKNVVADPEQRLALARKLLSEVERSPSAYLPELRAKLRQARAEAQAVLEADPYHPEGIELIARIDSLLAHLTPRPLPDHPTEAEAAVALERLEGLVKGGGTRSQVEAVHTGLRQIIRRLKDEKGFHGIAAKYASRAEYLWEFYASRLTKLEDLCAGCPTLDLGALAKGFASVRMLGAGDYTLDDLAAMKADPARHKPGYAPLLTGDFNGDGSMDVALIGRGRQEGKEKLFLLIASEQKSHYRRLFLQPLDWDKAALAAKEGNLILSMAFGAADHFWWLRWNGKTYFLSAAFEFARPDETTIADAVKRLGEPFLRYFTMLPEDEIDVFVKPLNTKEQMELARRAGQRGAGIQKVEVLQWRISEKTIEQAIFVFRGEKLWYAIFPTAPSEATPETLEAQWGKKPLRSERERLIGDVFWRVEVYAYPDEGVAYMRRRSDVLDQKVVFPRVK